MTGFNLCFSHAGGNGLGNWTMVMRSRVEESDQLECYYSSRIEKEVTWARVMAVGISEVGAYEMYLW